MSQTPGFSLSRREADVAVMVGKPSEPQLYFESLGTYRLGLYASRDYAEQHSLPEHVDELPGIDWLAMSRICYSVSG